ncbi:MAG TPA: trypsin-like peptidase domain-containing protein [Acidimicrobiales bacterium]|nr:trypsin-like peptidase domain-containing protein [Acidimicrobiales bacterium]
MTDEGIEQPSPDQLGSPEGDVSAAATPPPPMPPPSTTGVYALGALAGNPRLGATADGAYSGPPTNPGAPGWPAPPMPSVTPATTHRLRNSALVAAAAIVTLGVGVGVGHVTWTTNGSAPTSSAAPAPSQLPSGSGSGSSGFGFGGGSSGGGATSGPSDVSAIAKKVDPGLVDIDTTLGYSQEQAAGTGMVLTSSGEILTNNHVIDGATTISVTDVGNGKTYSASVVGYDRTGDIAVLQLHNASGLQTANLANSSGVSVGEDVVGIGNAGGTGGTPSAAGGTVTALNQSITASDEGDGSSEQLTGLIETNADIQAGDSGGPLVNTDGKVVGIDTAASAGFSFQSSGNQGYAIPINTALSIAKQIESSNASSTVHIGATAFLGIEISTASENQGGFNGNGFGGQSGVGGEGTSASGATVAGVVTSSPAQEAGLAEGDVITSVDGQTVSSPTDVTDLLEPHHPGDKVKIGWTDTSGGSHSATVQLTSGPPQ